jgi:prepilin-type N-terminal cleavage/methylation domain-containing protein
MHMTSKHVKGFTLIELMVVIIIIAVLAAIAVPVYKGYTLQAMTSEGQALVAAVAAAEKVYYAQTNTYMLVPAGGTMLDPLGVVGVQNTYFQTYTGTTPTLSSFQVITNGIGQAAGITITLDQGANTPPAVTITGT